MSNFLDWLAARMQEPSSYAGLASFLAIFHMSLPDGVVKNIAMAGAGVGGILAVVIHERQK